MRKFSMLLWFKKVRRDDCKITSGVGWGYKSGWERYRKSRMEPLARGKGIYFTPKEKRDYWHLGESSDILMSEVFATLLVESEMRKGWALKLFDQNPEKHQEQVIRLLEDIEFDDFNKDNVTPITSVFSGDSFDREQLNKIKLRIATLTDEFDKLSKGVVETATSLEAKLQELYDTKDVFATYAIEFDKLVKEINSIAEDKDESGLLQRRPTMESNIS